MKAWQDTFLTTVALLAASLFTFLLNSVGIGRDSLLMVYMIGVMCCAAVTHGYIFSVANAAISMMLFNYFYTEPLRTFHINSRDDATLLLFFLITAFISATMTVRFRRALEVSKANEQRAEKLAEEKNGALREAEQAHMKSSLLRSIGHDLRTPLTGIQCGSNYLAERADSLSGAEVRRAANDISSQVTWLITMVENILYMTRIDNEKLDVNKQPEVVDDVASEAVAHVLALRERSFQLSLPEDVMVVPMDGKMIVQVLVNLLDNAVQHTESTCRIQLSAYPCDGRMYFSVEDSGTGVPAEQRASIFESFVTSGKVGPDGRKGMGLGLAICRAVVMAHQGEITITDSVSLGGANFTFWLPMKEEKDGEPLYGNAGRG